MIELFLVFVVLVVVALGVEAFRSSRAKKSSTASGLSRTADEELPTQTGRYRVQQALKAAPPEQPPEGRPALKAAFAEQADEEEEALPSPFDDSGDGSGKDKQ